MLSKKKNLEHGLPEHIIAPVPIRMIRFDQLIQGAESAPARKMKKKEKIQKYS